MSPVIAIAIPAPPERHDELVCGRVAPVLRALHASHEPVLAWFERANKPDWGVHVLATGDDARLDREIRPMFTDAFSVDAGEARFVAEPAIDKWTGGPGLADRLSGFLRADTFAALDALAADARGALGSRATFSMLVVEGLLDAFRIDGADRLAFYRESFEWAIELGRWDREVLDSLERTFAGQRDALAALVASGASAWPSAEAAAIGGELLLRVGGWARSSSATPELALPAARGHSNRLGIHGGREAALRYLVWRTRGGQPLQPA